MTFTEYVREYELQRSEGLLLRYLAEVYKVLVQTVPATCKDEKMEEIIDFLGIMIRQVDSTLVDEWEKMRGGADARRGAAKEDSAAERKDDFDITANRKAFQIAVRNEVFQYVKALAREQLSAVVDEQRELEFKSFGHDTLRSAYAAYRAGHEGPLMSGEARAPQHFRYDFATGQVEQILVDTQAHNDWALRFTLDLTKTRLLGRPILELNSFSAL